MASEATRRPHHPLAAAEAKITALSERIATLERDLKETQRLRTVEHKSMEHYRNENMRLSAAISEAAGAVNRIASPSMWKKEASILATKLERWHVADRAELCYRALYRTRDDDGQRLAIGLAELEGGIFEKMKAQIKHERDLEIAEHLKNKVFSGRLGDTLRLCCSFSWRTVRWLYDAWCFDWEARDKDGNLRKARQTLAPDSTVPVPSPFPVREMREYEDTLVRRTGGNVASDDGRAAEITDVDATLLRALSSAETSRMGGMATDGTAENPHIVIITGDGGQLTDDESGVRLALLAGSVERLNQSVHGVHTAAFWRASEHAESWHTIIGRTPVVRKQLCRIFQSGELLGRADAMTGERHGSGVHVQLVLSADKPFLCKSLGRRSFAHDFFSPNCRCCRSKNELYDISKELLSHYDEDSISFEERCALALVPLHEALDLPEHLIPDDWTITRHDKVRAPRLPPRDQSPARPPSCSLMSACEHARRSGPSARCSRCVSASIA